MIPNRISCRSTCHKFFSQYPKNFTFLMNNTISLLSEWLPHDRELFLAVNYNDLTSVQQALRKGGNPNFIHPKFGWTVVHHAAKKGYTEVIKALLSSNITNPNIKDKFGKTPIQNAKKNGHKDIVEILSSLRQ